MTSTRPYTRSVALAMTVALGLGLAACSGSQASRTASDAAPSADAKAATGAKEEGVARSGASPSTTVSKQAQPASMQVLDQPGQPGRQIVSSAAMTVKVDDVVAAKERAKVKIDSIGGMLFNEQTSLGARSSATITYKVKPETFSDARRDLATLGKLASEEVKTDDVTQQVVDLDARIRAAEASTQRVSELVAKTDDVTELANLENEVQRRQAELESLRGQKRTLDARTELSTIVLTLTTDESTAQPKPAEAKALPGFLDGLNGGWNAFLGVVSVSGAVLGALLPFAWIVVLVIGLIWWKRRAGSPTPADA